MNGTWSVADIGGKRADVYDPPGPAAPHFGVLFLHGLDLTTLRGEGAFTRLFDELGLACVCPHGGPSWWGERVCPEFDARVSPERYLLDQVLPSFGERWGLRERAVGLLGVDMGGQGA